VNDFIFYLSQRYNCRFRPLEQEGSAPHTFSLHENGQLKTLCLNELPLKDLTFLQAIAADLEVLELPYCKLENLKGISAFRQLKSLDLQGNELNPKDFYALGDLGQLKSLNLEATDLEDASSFKELQQLEELFLGYNGGLQEIQGLENLKALKHINLAFTAISSIKKMDLNENIQSINLKATAIQDMLGLQRFTQLKALNLSGNKLSKIQGLEAKQSLKKLNISSAWLSEIEGLSDLVNLEILDLSNQELEKIKGLDYLGQLKQLNLAENKIKRVENLSALSQLEYLYLDANQIEFLSVESLAHFSKACCISLYGNPLKEIPQLPEKQIKIKYQDEQYRPKSL